MFKENGNIHSFFFLHLTGTKDVLYAECSKVNVCDCKMQSVLILLEGEYVNFEIIT